MFMRRIPKPFKDKLVGFFWPQRGWGRYGKYIMLRLSRLKGTSHEVAIGFACGVAISFTPFVGLHLVLGAVFAFLFGANILASAIGTLVGNPWTFPFIWVSILKTGQWFLGISSNEEYKGFVSLFANAMKALMAFDFKTFASDVWPIFYPMMVGSLPYCVVSFAVSYWFIRNLLDKLSKAKEKRRLKRLKKLEKKMEKK
ncbi:MAG: DUF2062 domain-containing protein [Alphaproteobacteria bacterium]